MRRHIITSIFLALICSSRLVYDRSSPEQEFVITDREKKPQQDQ
jgi:hypothetical protein